MLKRKYSELLAEGFNARKLASTWRQLANKFESDALRELSEIYYSLTGERTGKDLNYNYGVLEDAKHKYIYSIDGVVYYSSQQLQYPIDDKSLWPWTARYASLPTLSSDVIYLICNYSGWIATATLRLVCRQWRVWIDNNKFIWQQHAERLGKIFPFITPIVGPKLLQQFPPLYIANNTQGAARAMRNINEDNRLRLIYSLVSPHKIKSVIAKKINEATKWRILVDFEEAVLPTLILRMTKRSTRLELNWGTVHFKIERGSAYRSALYHFRWYEDVITGERLVGTIANWANRWISKPKTIAK